MLRNTLIIVSILALLFGCRPPATTGVALGNNSVIIKDVFDSALGGYSLDGAETRWSGADGDEKYSPNGPVTVKDANQQKILELLYKQLAALPTKHSWKGYDLTLINDNYLGFSYQDNSGNFYIDFILTQKDKDVEILVLSKVARN